MQNIKGEQWLYATEAQYHQELHTQATWQMFL